MRQMKDYGSRVKLYFEEEIQAIRNLDVNEISRVINILEETRKSKRYIYICGNGGSASTASHYCADFNKGVSENLDLKYRFICLNDNVPSMMAVANDFSYDDVFRFPLEGRIDKGDCFIGISGSGNSANVVRAMEYCNNIEGVKTIAIVGYDGGRLKEIANECIHVNVNNMQISEDVHMMLDHVMMYVLCNWNAK